MAVIFNTLILTVIIQTGTALKCWTCKGYIPSDCSRAVKSSMTSVKCAEGDSFVPVCIYGSQRGYTFQRRSLVERRCDNQYKDTKICDRYRERYNATRCKICATDDCNAEVAVEDVSVRTISTWRTKSKGLGSHN